MGTFEVTFQETNTDGSLVSKTATHEAHYVEVDDHGNLCGVTTGTTELAGGLSWGYVSGHWTRFKIAV